MTPAAGMDDGLDEVIVEFLVESRESLDRLDHDLVSLEADPADKQCLGSVFRTMHTVKGTSGFLGFNHLETLSHAAESLLSKVRDGELPFTPTIASALLQVADAIRQMLVFVETLGTDGDQDDYVLIEVLADLQRADQGASLRPEQSTTDSTATKEHLAVADSGAEIKGAHNDTATGDSTVRVDVGLLDRLMNLVGELVLARNQIVQYTIEVPDPVFQNTTQRLNLITRELQEGIMKTRMQPIGTVWARLPRIVRDLSIACGKQVRLELDGAATEMDRTIVEAIKDPLVHLVRNALDHGIETPSARRSAGKPPEGVISLRAYHEGGYVKIEMSDDGAGIDLERVRARALERVSSDEERARIAGMSDAEARGLVFLPGFSTAVEVTSVSGRGVGMDVVKTNIEKIGGSIEIDSESGKGSKLVMKIPLTLAIIPALIVTSGDHRYAIPQVSLLELVRVDAESDQSGIEYVSDAPVYRLRGQLLPVVRLREVLCEPQSPGALSEQTIVVIQADGRQFGLVVDSVEDTQEIVVKPLSAQLKSIATYSGATILGDGSVVLILDVLGVARRSNVLEGVDGVCSLLTQTGAERAARSPDSDGSGPAETLLVSTIGNSRRVAVCVDSVDRLEEVDPAALERTAESDVIQYRGGIMPLFWVSSLYGESPELTCDEKMQVIVTRARGRSLGLVVSEIVDIFTEDVELDRSRPHVGLRGSAVLGGHVTDVVDVEELAAVLSSAFATAESREDASLVKTPKTTEVAVK